MAQPNYQFEKRQRDLAKKNKQEEKRRQKLAGKDAADDGGHTMTANPDGTTPATTDDPTAAHPDSATTPES